MLLHSHCLSGHPVQSQETMVSFPVTVRDISQTDQGLSSDDWFMLSRSSNCVFFLGGGSEISFSGWLVGFKCCPVVFVPCPRCDVS